MKNSLEDTLLTTNQLLLSEEPTDIVQSQEKQHKKWKSGSILLWKNY